MNFRISKNGSNFVCGKGTFSQIWSHIHIAAHIITITITLGPCKIPKMLRDHTVAAFEIRVRYNSSRNEKEPSL